MYIATVPNRNSPPAILLREGYRENGKVKTRTLANLSMLPPNAIEILKRTLKGEQLVSVNELFEIVKDGSPSHGNVDAIMIAMKHLKFSRLLCSKASRDRELVVAMVASRLLNPQSKLATSRGWSDTTLADTLGIGDTDEDELYAAMDWLIERQDHIEKKLAKRHLQEGGMALYDLTSSYFEGVTCPLAARGHNRDGKKGKLQVNYGLLANPQGVPVAVSVFKGNTGDTKTLLPQVDKMREGFNISKFVLVGDRGMITQKQVDVLREIDKVDWITALRPEAIRKLLKDESIQMSLFDERNLFEMTHPDWPCERLVACRNPALAERRKIKRESLLKATADELEKVRRMVGRGRLRGKKEIEKQVLKILGQYKIGKHYTVEIHVDSFKCKLNKQALDAEFSKGAGIDETIASKRRERYAQHVAAIDGKLTTLTERIAHGQLHGTAKIGVRVGKVVNKYKVAKHFKLTINDDSFSYEINQESVNAEAALDGIYVVRTSVKKEDMDAGQAVRSYKQLSNVERAFRCIKGVDVLVRPIHHRLAKRVNAHILICMLAYYVRWHMAEAWRPLLFADEDQEAKSSRDPVAPAERSEKALKKIATKKLEDGSRAHSFRTLLDHLGKIVRNTCRYSTDSADTSTFYKTTNPNNKQQQALDLLQTITF
jgi:transposase